MNLRLRHHTQVLVVVLHSGIKPLYTSKYTSYTLHTFGVLIFTAFRVTVSNAMILWTPDVIIYNTIYVYVTTRQTTTRHDLRYTCVCVCVTRWKVEDVKKKTIS